jgi:hypothetical protein
VADHLLAPCRYPLVKGVSRVASSVGHGTGYADPAAQVFSQPIEHMRLPRLRIDSELADLADQVK